MTFWGIVVILAVGGLIYWFIKKTPGHPDDKGKMGDVE